MNVKKSWKLKLSALDKRIEGFKSGYRQNLAILGLDTEEISYLLDNYLIENKYNDFIYIRVSVNYKDSKDFFKDIALSFFSEYSGKIESLDYFLLTLENNLPNTVNFIKNALKKNNITFFDAVELLDKIVNETNKKYIFLLENFTDIDDIFNSWYQAFAKFIILQRNCMIVLTSSDILKAENILANELNLLFGNFEKIYIDNINFIDKYLYFKSCLPSDISEFAILFFVNILGNNLIYYDLISDIIKNNYKSSEEVDSLIRILEEVLYRKDGYFYQKYIKKIEFLREKFMDYYNVIKVLLSISDGYIRKSELVSLNIYDSKTLKSKLDRLNKFNYIINLGNIYKISDHLFSFWLLNIFRVNIMPLSLQMKYFFWRENLKKEINNFKDKFYRDKVEKIKDLLSYFRDDIIYINNIKYILPHIGKLKVILSDKEDLYFLTPYEKDNVFCGLKVNNTNDIDMFEFLNEANKYKQSKKIFISTGEISSSAKLLAKNYKTLAFDYNDINNLFSIYNLRTLIFEKEIIKNACVGDF